MTAPRLARLGTWLTGSILALCASGAAAQAAPQTLRDVWLSLDTPPPSPAYTFYQRRADGVELPQRLTRLAAELETISQEMTLAPGNAMPGIISWHDHALTLAATPHQSRSLGRADLATLVARPRLNPSLASLDKAGFCSIPDWVELWHPAGVTRVAYRPGLMLDDALAEVGLASDASRATITDKVIWISPMGDLRRVGVQAYNHQSLSLPPGSRVVVPISHDSPSARWVNTHLPDLLATRLPGDDCHYLITDSPTTADPS
ncbi:hypothetical protein BCL93_1055 [Onishia taeanensis]|uniref:Capsule biosynthesis GfcC n=1 Tax=Onishia taeanensis TaxID=284577 RepID=A0A328XQG9_9GAMM|nr:hypothetical protein BCL93_1055 [Halomonas taeanensis]